MPIDDVQYLLRNSVKDSVMMFIDSSHRNRQKYPTPSQYTVELDEPIAHVYGIDILDAAIPSTMYNVDTNNNTMRFVAVATSQSELLAPMHTGVFDAEALDADHMAKLNTSMAALGLASPLRTVWLPDPNHANYNVVVGAWDDAGAPFSLAALAPDTSVVGGVGASGVVGVQYRALREMRFGPLHMWRVSAGSSVSAVVPPGVATMQLTSNGQTYYLELDGSAASRDAAAAIDGMATRDAIMRQFAILPHTRPLAADDQYDVFVYSTYTLPNQAAFDATNADMGAASSRRLRFDVVAVEMEVGNYSSLKDLQTAMAFGFEGAGLDAVVTSTKGQTSGNDNRGTFRFETTSDTRLMFAVAHSTARTTLGFDLDTDLSVHAVARAQRPNNAVTLGGEVAPMFCTVLQDDGTQRLDTPGIVSLAGPRYIALRCPQIETHMSSTSRYGRSGIGVFKLLNTNEIAQLRFDYVSLVRKPFHPIARLSRLQLSFELPDGTLYDFKGVNHQLMLTVNYYVPSAGGGGSTSLQAPPQAAASKAASKAPSNAASKAPSQAASRSLSDPAYILNPNYNPNFIDYLANRADPFGQAGSKLGGYDPYNEDNDVDDYDDDEGDEGDEGDDDDDDDYDDGDGAEDDRM